MPILDIQAKMRELGRIRMGVQVETTKAGKTTRRPSKLDTFRLTSPSKPLIDAAAAAYGGSVEEWADGDRHEWQVIVEATAIDIVMPPGQMVNQWYELWAAGGCQRRCDGQVNVLTMGPCLCPEDVPKRVELAQKGEACKATTRLNVMLPKIPDLGVWRLETHSWYAAVELLGAADILIRAADAGLLIPALLRIDQRERKVPGQPLRTFPVPVIEFTDLRVADLPLFEGSGPGAALLAAPARRSVPALPATTLPPTSDFRARPGSPVTELEPEVAQDSTDVGAAAGRPETGGTGMSATAFRDWLKQQDISAKYVDDVFRLVWPGREPGELTNDERARLRAAIERARAGERI